MKYKNGEEIVDAFQWTGDENQLEDPEWIIDAVQKGKVNFPDGREPIHGYMLLFKKLGCMVMASKNDYIIKDNKGELYTCKPDDFEKKYEKVENE